jgi:Kef-type K+ transport system membrane component KefB
MTNAELASLLLFQVACLLLACRAVGLLTVRLGQPQVMAEMLAGFLLGPSFFGVVAPQFKTLLFPPESMSVLYVVSQVGLVLYMFCVGMDFRVHLLLQHRRAAVAISAAGIIVPFILGGILAVALLTREGLFPSGVNDVHAVVFMGAAMSITAFPMLARIISERGIAGTAVGSLALAAGAIGDAVAWIILATASSLFAGSSLLALVAAGGALLYGVAVFVGLERLLRKLAADVTRLESIPPSVLTLVLCLLAFAGWFTDLIGAHSVFGAFLLGVAVPRGPLSVGLRRTIEPLTTTFLVPLFFVYTGLNSQLTLVNTGALWAMTGAIFLSACVGKGAACWAAARLAGVRPADALGVATLMNCRGMVELILLNIGLQQGLITPTLFTMMVLMAIGTTLMTGPLFGYVWSRSNEPVMDPSLAAERRW